MTWYAGCCMVWFGMLCHALVPIHDITRNGMVWYAMVCLPAILVKPVHFVSSIDLLAVKIQIPTLKIQNAVVL